MDTSAFISAQCERNRTPGDVLYEALQDLEQYDFKRFKDKLTDFPYGGRPPISRGRLENADCVAIKNLLIDVYGEEAALDVTIRVFKLINFFGLAEHLQHKVTQHVNPVKMSSNTTLEVNPVKMSSNTTLGEQLTLLLPKHWKEMGDSLVMVVDVPAGTSEYSDVLRKFAQTCRNRILKIERIQNKDLWMNYKIKKQSINTKNRSTNNERQLFHGTDANSIQNIIHNGFNRSYAGRNAATFGNGTCFAVDANYSAQSTFSRPDSIGQKHMYLASVLTGVFCAGKMGMVAPPAKNQANPTDLYDSVTDNTANPSLFVIFNDIQAYPEYHITFI